jgi:hypothetical protein
VEVIITNTQKIRIITAENNKILKIIKIKIEIKGKLGF